MRRTQLNFDETTYAQLASYAHSQGTSLSEAARKLIARQIEKEDGKAKAHPLLGLIELGEKYQGRKKLPADLGKNHDYYLYVEPYLRKRKKKNK